MKKEENWCWIRAEVVHQIYTSRKLKDTADVKYKKRNSRRSEMCVKGVCKEGVKGKQKDEKGLETVYL